MVVRYLCCLDSVNKVLSRLQFVSRLVSQGLQYSSQVQLDSWYVGDPQNETIGRIGMFGLCSFGSPYSLGGCGTGHLSPVVASNVDSVRVVR